MNKTTLTEINEARAAIINSAIDTICSHKERGVPYTAGQLSIMSDGIISEAAFRESLNRGWRTLRNEEKVKRRRWFGLEDKYCLFNSSALCGRIEERPQTITVKEYDENGTLIREYKKDKYYLVITF